MNQHKKASFSIPGFSCFCFFYHVVVKNYHSSLILNLNAPLSVSESVHFEFKSQFKYESLYSWRKFMLWLEFNSLPSRLPTPKILKKWLSQVVTKLPFPLVSASFLVHVEIEQALSELLQSSQSVGLFFERNATVAPLLIFFASGLSIETIWNW